MISLLVLTLAGPPVDLPVDTVASVLHPTDGGLTADFSKLPHPLEIPKPRSRISTIDLDF